ncbi:MAG: DinB family protein [Bryobacteraceae bacterium]
MKDLLAVSLALAGWISLGSGAKIQSAKTSNPLDTPTIASIMDLQLTFLEGQIVPAAEAMPDDKYSFAPNGSSFDGVRTFALEVKHVATANTGFYSAILGQDPPAGVSLRGLTNGPDSIQTKDQILKYLKDSFTLGHKALATLTLQNAVVPLARSPIPFMKTRLDLATFSLEHAADHYGQMIEYLRMNGITPPASNGQPSANPSKP